MTDVLYSMQPERGAKRFMIAARWELLAGSLLAFVIGVVAAFVMMSVTEGFVSNDDYYHSRIAAEIIEQRSLRVDFPWLPLTILKPDAFVDHHLLYHAYLAPFAYWGGIAGAKFAQMLVVGGIFGAFWLLLRHLQIRPAWVWLIALLAVSAPFLYRTLMVRTQGAAVLVLLLALIVLFSRRYRWLAPIAFAFTWLYNGFVLLPVFTGLYLIAAWVTDRQFVWRPVAYVLIGTAAGLIINPYFPHNIAFALDHLGEKVAIAEGVRVGSEWYPYTTGALLQHSAGMLLALAAGIFAPSLRRTGRDRTETLLLLVALVTLYMAFESRRFIEYAPVFALLFGAAALGRGGIDWERLLPPALTRLPLTHVYAYVLAVPVLALAGLTMHTVQQDIASTQDSGYMAGAAAWLQANTEPQALVFQTDWDDFPYLFHHNTHNTYLVGLDPTYLQLEQPDLWNLWVPITEGIVERPSVLIRERFGASYVVSDTQHGAFARSADSDPAMALVYRDDHSLIWQIVDTQPER